MLRKRWIESRVRAKIAAGASQVVVLGAGLDTLGVRLASERPDLRVVEIDHPATLAVKRSVVERKLGAVGRSWRRPIYHAMTRPGASCRPG